MLLYKAIMKGRGHSPKSFCGANAILKGISTRFLTIYWTQVQCTITSLQPQRSRVTPSVLQSKSPCLTHPPRGTLESGFSSIYLGLPHELGCRLSAPCELIGTDGAELQKSPPRCCVLPNRSRAGSTRKPGKSCQSSRTLMKMLSLWESIRMQNQSKCGLCFGFVGFFLKCDLKCRSALNKCSQQVL